MEHIVFIEAPVTGAGIKGLQYAKQENMYITFITNNFSKYEKKGFLDFIDNLIICDTNSEKEVINTINNIESEKHITSVMTFADFYVPKVALAAEYLGLPCMSYKAAINCRNKYFMREVINKNCSEYNPKYYVVDSLKNALEKANLINYPLIMKPLDENDSYNVLLIKTSKELIDGYLKITSNDYNRVGQRKFSNSLLLEEYITYQEYSVETYTINNETHLIGITKKFLDGIERGNFIEIAHAFPIREIESEVFSVVKKILKELEINNAICHTEIKVDLKNNNFKVVEVNPRLAGGGIGSDMIELSTGTSAVQYAIDIIRKKNDNFEFLKNDCSVIYKIQANKEGIFNSIEFPDWIENDNNFVKKELFIEIGNFVRPPKLNGDLIGYILVKGEKINDTLNFAKKIIDSVKIDII